MIAHTEVKFVSGLRSLMMALACLLFVAPLSDVLAAKDSKAKDPVAEKFIDELAEEGLTILNDPNASMESKKKVFGDLVINNADLKRLGRFTLGHYVRKASDEELEEFYGLYEQYMRNFYESRMGDFNGERLDVTGSVVPNTKKPDRVVVTSKFILGPESEILVNWDLEKITESQYTIVDMEVAGIWMVREQKSQFTSVLGNNNGKMEPLLVKLRDIVDRGESFSIDTQAN